MNRALSILYNAIPIAVMMALIPLVKNDWVLAVVYILIIAVALKVRYEKNDNLVLLFGFLVMIASELFFISTGVETFSRRTLFGKMPLWLPFLWAYAFVAMKRAVAILT
jgi:hypothetical protein